MRCSLKQFLSWNRIKNENEKIKINAVSGQSVMAQNSTLSLSDIWTADKSRWFKLIQMDWLIVYQQTLLLLWVSVVILCYASVDRYFLYLVFARKQYLAWMVEAVRAWMRHLTVSSLFEESYRNQSQDILSSYFSFLLILYELSRNLEDRRQTKSFWFFQWLKANELATFLIVENNNYNN